MKKTDTKYQAFIQILREELIPAMGCTEPIALAYAAAIARDTLEAIPERIEVEASGSLIKNVKSVIVPNTQQLKGNAEKELEVIAEVSEEQIQEMKRYLEQTPITVKPLNSGITFDLIIKVYKGTSYSKIRIANYHTNVVLVEKDHNILEQKEINEETEEGLTDRSLLSMEDIWDFSQTVDIEDVRAIIHPQIVCNMEIAEEGIRGDYGANIGSVLLGMGENNVQTRAKAMAAAASDARMNGCELPVVINSGSGNQGITTSVPVIVYARDLKVSEEQMYRALVLANLTTIHQKTPIGRLSAYCGAVSAGVGAGAGIAYLCGGGYREIIHTVVNAVAIVSGMVCDGAKASCAAKIASSVDAGILGYYMYKNGQQFYGGDGLVTKGVEATLKNIGRLGKEGMKETNREIIRIMTEEPC